MLVSFILSLVSRRRGFSWSPSLDLRDNQLYSTLLPGTHL
jgi:hypothetical protein